jgi:hypothetical protein
MDHFKILKRAWQITWKYRALWLVGLLLVLAGGGIGSGFNGGSSAAGGGSGRGGSGGGSGGPPFWGPQDFPGLPGMRARVAPIVGAIVAVAILVVLLAILVGVGLTILRYVTRTSLIRMVQGYEETGEEIGFRGGMRLGWSRSAFRLFLLDLMTRLPLALLIMLMIAPLVAFAVVSFTAGGEPRIVLGILLLLLIIPVVLLGIALGIVLGPILEVAYRTCALEDLGAWEALKGAFALIRRHLGPTALQWLLLVGLRIAWGIALIPVNLLLVVLALFVGGLPALVVGGVASQAVEWPMGLALGALVFVPAFIVVVGLPNLALSTLATVYYSTTWTLTYRELVVLDADSGAEVEPRVGDEADLEVGPEEG